MKRSSSAEVDFYIECRIDYLKRLKSKHLKSFEHKNHSYEVGKKKNNVTKVISIRSKINFQNLLSETKEIIKHFDKRKFKKTLLSAKLLFK